MVLQQLSGRGPGRTGHLAGRSDQSRRHPHAEPLRTEDSAIRGSSDRRLSQYRGPMTETTPASTPVRPPVAAPTCRRAAGWSRAIPGPRSQDIHARRTAAVAKGVSSTLPIYIEKAGGGVLVDVDGNSLIDLGAGHRRRQRRQRPPAVSSPPSRSRSPRSPTPASWSRRTTGTSRSASAEPADARRLREAVGAVQLRRRGGGERGQGGPRRDRPGRRRGVRPRLPRAHQPDDGDDREGHALQARLRAVRRRGLPRSPVLPVPRARGDLRHGRCPARDRTSSRSRWVRTRSPAW